MCYAVLRSKHTYIYYTRYLIDAVFDISIQFKLCQYCITGLMYRDMAMYRYIVASLAYKHVHMHTHTCTHLYTYTHVYTHTYTYILLYTYTHTHTCTHTHTHIHVHIHTHSIHSTSIYVHIVSLCVM